KVAPKTLKVEITSLSSAFNLAFNNEIIQRNPFKRAMTIRPLNSEASEKEPFTANDLMLLKKTATGDWLTALLLGAYTGARISDCANQKWDNVDFNTKFI